MQVGRTRSSHGGRFACVHSDSFSVRDVVDSLTFLSCSDTWMFQRQWDVANY
jgi:hypothetical protein